MRDKEQFHLYYGADQLILFHKTLCESGSSIIESELRSTSSSACSCTLTRKCDDSRRDVCSNDWAHTANGPCHVSEYDVASTSAHIPHKHGADQFSP